MNKNKCRFLLALFLISNISFATLFLIQIENDVLSTALASTSSSNSTSIVREGNSTFSNSSTGEDGGGFGISSSSSSSGGGDDDDNQQNVGTVIVIPNPNSNSNSSSAAPNTGSLDINESELAIFNDTDTKLENNKSIPIPSSTVKDDLLNQQASSANNSSTSPGMQRGEYLVDDNGIHYYNINNCSMVKGSSGIGDLSECEDAEREIQEELTG